MKTGLAVPLLFLGAFLALVALISGVYGLVLWGRYFDAAAAGPGVAELSVMVLRDMHATLLISAVLAALAVLFRLLRLTRSPTIPLIVLWLLLAATLYGGISAAAVLRERLSPAGRLARAPIAGTLLRLPQAAIYIEQRDHNDLRGVLVWRQPAGGAAAQGFSLYPYARYEPSTELIQPIEADGAVAPVEVLNGPWTMFEPPAVLVRLVGDTQRAAAALDSILQRDRVAGILTLSALALIVTMSWIVVRLTRWPLFNAILAVGWIRLLIYLLPLGMDPRLQQPLQRMLPAAAELSHYLYPLILAAVGLLLVVISIVMPSFAHWKREVRGG